MTNSKCEESDGVRKVRLKTTSGVLTLCYRSSQSSREADNSQADASDSIEKASQGGSQVSGFSNLDSGFGSLPELFEFSDQFSIGEGFDGCSNLRPDFSTNNFWASEWGHNLPHAVGLPDAFSSPCNLTGIVDDNSALGFQEPIVDDAHCPEDRLQNCATKQDPHFQNTVRSATIVEMNTIRNGIRKSCWDFPLELEEDIFECANYWNLVKEVTDEREGDHGETVTVDDFLVDGTPSDFCDDVANAENLDSNVLVYAPNRYLESDVACIFQSPPADLESDIETLETVSGHRMNHDSQKLGTRRRKGTVREDCLKDGQSMAIKSRNSDTTAASCIEPEPDAYDVHQDVIGKQPPMSESKSGDKARVLRIYDFVNHRRRRFSALRGKRSKFPKRTTLTSLDLKQSPNQPSPEIKPVRLVRSPIRKSETARRLFRAAASSSDSQSAGESDHNCDKSSFGSISQGRQLSVPSDHRKTHVGHRAETSQGKSASTSLLKDTQLNRSSSRGAPTLRFSPLKDILVNRGFNREAPILKSSSNPCLPRKKRTRYADHVFHSPDDSNKVRTRLHTELSLSQDSPQKIKCSNASTPARDRPAQFRSPKVSRKKVRTSRKRTLQGSPTSAKKLHSYGEVIYGGSSQVLLKDKSPEREGQSETKSAGRKLGRRRLPLPPSSVEKLQGWLHENLQDPYPSRHEKEHLLFQTGLKMSQIDNWLGNARQKLKLKSRAVKDLCSDSSLSPEQPKKQSRRIARSYPL